MQFVKMIDAARPEGQGERCLHSRQGRKSDTYNTERGRAIYRRGFILSSTRGMANATSQPGRYRSVLAFPACAPGLSPQEGSTTTQTSLVTQCHSHL